MMTFTVPESTSPMSVKDYLRRHSGLSLTAWRKIKTSGSLLVNSQPVLPRFPVKAGDIIAIAWPQECSIIPTFLPLTICYEDEYLLVVDKPSGMLVHPTTDHTNIATLANAIMFYFQQQQLPYAFHPVHRLDRNTSGLLLIAKLPHIQHLLTQENTKPIKKSYLGLVSGHFESPTGLIDEPIGRHPNSIIERIVRPDGQYAATRYRVLQELKQASLVELELLTGRTHQIRVHLSYIGHPLLGDDLYGGSTKLINHQALHASRLSFTHPVSGKLVIISCQLPDDVATLLTHLSS
jgi:23S rRNA pseudouridine1911/1915/1917 synthase